MGLFSKLKDQLAKVQQENRENAAERTAPSEIFDRMRQKIEETQKKVSKKKGRTRNSGSIFSQLKDKIQEAKVENEVSTTEETAEPSILERVQAELDKLEKKKKPVKIEKKKAPAPAWGSPTGVPSVDDILGRVTQSAKKEQAKKAAIPKKEEEFGSIFDQIMGSDKPKASKASSTKKTSTKKSVPVSDFGDVFDKIITQESSRAASSSSGGGGNAGLYVGGTGLVDGKGGSLALRVDPNMGAGKLRQRLPDNVNVRILDHTDQNSINLDGQKAGWYKVDYNGQQGWVLDLYLE